jgi:hypothetical protein
MEQEEVRHDWHGLRPENRFDGTHETQDAIPVGGRYTARVTFPAPGISWSTHAAMGRFGNVVLVAGDPELTLTARAGEVVAPSERVVVDVLFQTPGSSSPTAATKPTSPHAGHRGRKRCVDPAGTVELKPHPPVSRARARRTRRARG